MSAKTPAPAEAAFVLEAGDRFHIILVSDGVHFEVDPAAETVITFFVIRRASGAFEIVNITKTFSGGKCVSRNIQIKAGILAGRIDREVTNISAVFAAGIEKTTGYRIRWHRLDLSAISDHSAQITAIAGWGRVDVSADGHEFGWRN